ncbi:MAG TPA: BTAD domain-containing putative transcriptional regulator [Streptosporangiaceae bacterium]|nr:BTAD domain-containing putative transcriptional regulator [Streptosporangiaceae bacterium]
MQVRLLGPVDVALDDGSRPVPGSRRQAVLAALALHDGQVVSTDRLVEIVWGESAPPTAVNSLQTHISYLRGILGSKVAILARPPGYQLNLGIDDRTDVRTAEQLLRQGRQADDPVQGVRDLEEALALWRGRPLEDLVGSVWLEEQARRLDLLADEVRRTLFEARLAAGEHAEIVPGLEQMAAADPLDEAVHGQLMLALYRCGRQAEALAVFRRLRDALAGQLGIDPSPMVRDLETAILRQDHALDVPPQRPAAPAARPVPVPAQLPPAVPGFVGRAGELGRLDLALAQARPGNSAGSAAVVISAVSGTAGVGKTALALQWAHQVAERFPDGQLYVNLRGFSPGGQPAEPGEAISGFLDGLGAPRAGLPDSVPAQAALYRSLLAGKRVLILLDNAKDAEQVRPLLPGSPGCLVIVTSRNDLASLAAVEGACPVSLDLLTPAEATDLLTRRLGEARVAAEPEAVEQIIDRCARLPLALAIAAARAAVRPTFPLAAIAAELGEATAALDPFSDTDLATDVRAVFSWSCRALSDDAARLFRLLGLHPGPDISVNVAASLAGLSSGRAHGLLAELAHANLLLEYAPARYSLHDLLRAYATELADRHDSEQQRQAAMGRMLDHYLHTAHAAASLLDPHRDLIVIAPAQPGVVTQRLRDTMAALTWFTAEHRNLLAMNALGLRLGFDTHTWQLAWAMGDFLSRNCRWADHHAVHRSALQAAERSGHKDALAYSHRGLGVANSRLGRQDAACRHYEHALQLFGEIGDHPGQAITHFDLAIALEAGGNYTDALRHAQHAHDHYQALGQRVGQARSLNGIGWMHSKLGDCRQALPWCQQALATLQELGDTVGAAYTMDSVAAIHHQLGDQHQAIACYRQARELYRTIGESEGEAEALTLLGDIHYEEGEVAAARHAWRQALDLFSQLDHPDAQQIRAKLSASQVLLAPQAG